MRIRLVRRLGGLAVGIAVAMSTSIGSAPARRASEPAQAATVERIPINTVSARVFAAALEGPGEIVRTQGAATVERVPVQGAPTAIYRVTVRGRFPARAERYVVTADGRPIGFGVPDRAQRALRTVTTDAAVLTGHLATGYGDPRPVHVPTETAPDLPNAPSAMANPAARGPHEVSRREYDLGDQVFQPSELPEAVELVGDVHFPTDIENGPYPLVLFMHGNHSTCYRGNRSSYEWPCRRGWRPLPNHEGYDYIAERLASWGYVVVSVSANGVNVLGNFVDDTGMRQRGEVLERHIDLWREWSTVEDGPFGATFVGNIDLSRIGTMGHSRGGEGVVWNVIVDREREIPYGIDAVLALAPVDFTRVPINEVAFDVMLPYCDGDVSDLQGIHFFDDSRYLVPDDPAPKSTVTVMGANHNFFNRVWSPSGGYPGAFNDGRWVQCRNQLTESQQRHVGAAYITGFFRRYLGHELALDPMWTGADAPPVPATTLVSYLAPTRDRLDVDRFADAADLARGEIGPVAPIAMSTFGWCSDEYLTPCLPGGLQWYDVHLSFSFFAAEEQLSGLGQGVLGWTGPLATVRFAIPFASADVSVFDALQLRAALNPSYAANEGVGTQDFAIVLEDGVGRRSTVTASEVGNAPLAYPLGRRGGGHYLLNQIRFPLELFTGIDKHNIRAVELVFTQTPSGVIDVADLAFSRGAG
jgi:hypothetical protein